MRAVSAHTSDNLIFCRFLPQRMVENINHKYMLKSLEHQTEVNISEVTYTNNVYKYVNDNGK